MTNFDLSSLALQSVCPGNELLYDSVGLPSVMVKIPRMTYAQLGLGTSTEPHPAFIVDGKTVDAIWIGKYQACVHNGRAYSLPGRDPLAYVDFDTAKGYCDAKGPGWHVTTAMEWGLLKLWCTKNGSTPKGNNNWGMHNTETVQKAIPTYRYDENGVNKIGRVATGTGPLTWYHDGSPSGIADLCGNVWEWTGGIRIVYGEVQILINNNAANGAHSLAVDSAEWKAIRASDGVLITPNGNGTTPGSVKMDFVSNAIRYSTSITTRGAKYCTWGSIGFDSTIGAAAKILLQALGMAPQVSNDIHASQGTWFNNNEAERFFFSGCNWGDPGCGLASFYGSLARSVLDRDVGFRVAYVQLQSGS